MAGCSQEEGSKNNPFANATLTLDSTSVASLAVSSFADIEYFLRQLFDIVREIDRVKDSPAGFSPFSCSMGSLVYGVVVDSNTSIAGGDSFGATLTNCQIGSDTFTGSVTVTLSSVASGESYFGDIEFDEFSKINSGGDFLELDGELEFGVDVTLGQVAIIAFDSDVEVTSYQGGMVMDETIGTYKNLEFEWALESNNELLLDIEVDITLAFTGPNLGGLYFIDTQTTIDRNSSDAFPAEGRFTLFGADGGTYELSSNGSALMLSGNLDANGDGLLDLDQPPAPTWRELSPLSFLVPDAI